MNILLTGATGFLGSQIAKKLSEGNKIFALVREHSNVNITNLRGNEIKVISTENLFSLLSENTFDVVIHSATEYGRNGNLKTEVYEANVILPSIILSSLKAGTVFINIDTFQSKFEETTYYRDYSDSKKIFKNHGKKVSSYRNIKFINCFIEHMYGINDKSNKFIPFIIKECLNNENINLSSGEQKRDFIYVEDVSNAIKKIVDNLENLSMIEDFEIGRGETISIKEMVMLIHKLTKSKSKLNFGILPHRTGEIMYSKANNEKLKKIGWEPQYYLEKGVNKTIDHYRQMGV